MELEVWQCMYYNNPDVLSEMPCHFSDLIMCSPVCDYSHWVGSTDFHSIFDNYPEPYSCLALVLDY